MVNKGHARYKTEKGDHGTCRNRLWCRGGGLGLTEADLRFSMAVFRRYGNMSSPTVLFALKEILDQGHPKRGDRGILLSFGAGFTAFAALVEFA